MRGALITVGCAAALAGCGGGGKDATSKPPPIPLDSPDPALVASAEAAVSQAEATYLERIQAQLRAAGTPVSSVTTRVSRSRRTSPTWSARW